LGVENGGKGGAEGWVDDVLEIGSGVTGGPGSGHAVDDGGLMSMVVESIAGIGEIIVIKLRGEGKVH
jgi:hypothetical protein